MISMASGMRLAYGNKTTRPPTRARASTSMVSRRWGAEFPVAWRLSNQCFRLDELLLPVHARHVFEKLGARSRTELAGRVTRDARP